MAVHCGLVAVGRHRLTHILSQVRREAIAEELLAQRRECLSKEQREWLEQRSIEELDATTELSLTANHSNLPSTARTVSSPVRTPLGEEGAAAVPLTRPKTPLLLPIFAQLSGAVFIQVRCRPDGRCLPACVSRLRDGSLDAVQVGALWHQFTQRLSQHNTLAQLLPTLTLTPTRCVCVLLACGHARACPTVIATFTFPLHYMYSQRDAMGYPLYAKDERMELESQQQVRNLVRDILLDSVDNEVWNIRGLLTDVGAPAGSDKGTCSARALGLVVLGPILLCSGDSTRGGPLCKGPQLGHRHPPVRHTAHPKATGAGLAVYARGSSGRGGADARGHSARPWRLLQSEPIWLASGEYAQIANVVDITEILRECTTATITHTPPPCVLLAHRPQRNCLVSPGCKWTRGAARAPPI